MTNPSIKYCSFQEDLIHKVLSEQPAEGTLFVFPNESSKRAAIREFQKSWTFSRTAFTTMEQVKNMLIVPEKPLLRDNKRSMAFYLCLSDEDKSYFKIYNYFQSLELSRNFFELWEEFNEELVDPQKLNNYDRDILEWQSQTFARLQTIKEQYANLIHSRGFDDVIFSYLIHRDALEGFDYGRVVFVNQFYYTGLEKSLIQLLCDHNIDTALYFQMPQGLVDAQELTIKKFALHDISEINTSHLHIFESPNDLSMILALTDVVQKAGVRTLVDVSFSHRPYSRFLSLSAFNLSSTEGMEKTSIFHFFSALQSLIDQLIWEQKRAKRLMPLSALMDAVLCENFIHHFIAGPVHQKKEKQAVMLEDIMSLLDEDYQYIDLEGEFFRQVSNRCERHLMPLMQFIEKILTIRSIADLIGLVDQEDGILIRRIITPRELECSDILDTFYRLLSDFTSLENPVLIQDWFLFFNAREDPAHFNTIPAGILRLLVESLKSAHVKYNYKTLPPSPVEITDLENTRGLHYSGVAILNVIENQIPHARRPTFLFTEQQRRFLGLKTYEDVRLREKYYFARLVLTTPEVFLFTQKNIDDNIEASSFLEELRSFIPQNIQKEIRTGEPDYQSLCQSFYNSSDYQVDVKRTAQQDFYIIAHDRKKDFPDGSVDLTYYKWQAMDTNLFTFFIEHICRIAERAKEITPGIAPKFLGNLAHDIFLSCWQDLLKTDAVNLFGTDFRKLDHDFIVRNVKKVFKLTRVYYQMPHDHTLIYLEHILQPIIINGIVDFFGQLDSMGLSHKQLTIIPEKEYTENKRRCKVLLTAAENPLGIPVALHGRADLLIHDPGDDRHFIFDYKTGASADEQLAFYELYYHILENDKPPAHIESYFFQVLENELKKLPNPDKSYAKIKSSVMTSLHDIHSRGFGLPRKKTALKEMRSITRSDLYIVRKCRE